MAVKSGKPCSFYFFNFSDDIFKQSTKSGISSGRLHHDHLLTRVIPTEATVSSPHSINHAIYCRASGKPSSSDHLVKRCCSSTSQFTQGGPLGLATSHTSPYKGLQHHQTLVITLPQMISTRFTSPVNQPRRPSVENCITSIHGANTWGILKYLLNTAWASEHTMSTWPQTTII